MIALARLLAWLLGILLMALIAVVGVVVAVFCIAGGDSTLSLPQLASDIHLPQLRGDVDFFLGRTTAHGSIAVLAAVGGAAAMLIGIALIVGCWVRPRPRRIVLAHEERGSLGSHRRPLARLAADRVDHGPQVARARARARARRRGDGGRVRVSARAALGADRRTAREAARETLGPLLTELPLQVMVRGRRASREDRRAMKQVSS